MASYRQNERRRFRQDHHHAVVVRGVRLVDQFGNMRPVEYAGFIHHPAATLAITGNLVQPGAVVAAVVLVAAAFEERFRLAIAEVQVRKQDRGVIARHPQALTRERRQAIAMQRVVGMHQPERAVAERQWFFQRAEDDVEVIGALPGAQQMPEPAIAQHAAVALPKRHHALAREPACQPFAAVAGAAPGVEDDITLAHAGHRMRQYRFDRAG